LRALLHRRVHAASTPIHAKCRDSEIPFLLLQSPPHACRKQTGRLLELFSQPIQLFKDLTVGVHLPFLSPPLVCFSLLAESAVKVVFLILPKLQTQHPFGVSGCILALKSGVLARRFSINHYSICKCSPCWQRLCRYRSLSLLDTAAPISYSFFEISF